MTIIFTEQYQGQFLKYFLIFPSQRYQKITNVLKIPATTDRRELSPSKQS